MTIPEPEGYDPKEFACACANPVCITPKEPDRVWSKEMMITYGKLPNHKYMINWPIEGNDYYINLLRCLRRNAEKLWNMPNIIQCVLSISCSTSWDTIH